MDLRQIMKGYFISAEDIVMILNFSGDGCRNSSRSRGVRESIQSMADRAMESDRYYDLTGGDSLRNGVVIGTPFLASTLARNRLCIDAGKGKGKGTSAKASGKRI